MKIGDSYSQIRSFSYNDVLQFSELSKDKNPIHLDESYARDTQFGNPIVHGMLAASIFSAIIANELPGSGSIYLHQDLDFRSPLYHNVRYHFEVKILNIREDKPIFELSTICMDEDLNEMITGKAIVKNDKVF